MKYSLFFRYPYSGGSYGGYGSGYGAYSSGYGAYNNNNTYNTFLTEINNLPAIQSLQSVVHTAGSVSVMLESCYSAVLASFQAMVGVADQFSKVLSDLKICWRHPFMLVRILFFRYLCDNEIVWKEETILYYDMNNNIQRGV